MTLAEFRRIYPIATFTTGGGAFTYRYYNNTSAKTTLVLLTGGIGLSDLFYKHFARFAQEFSVLTFDYQLQFADNGEFADAVAELLRHLKEKVWLVGQSLGGVVAQIIAQRHPEVVEGLILSNTCSLSGSMSEEGYQDLMKMIGEDKLTEFKILNTAYEYVDTVLADILKSITIESLLSQSIETWYLAPCLIDRG